jgi:uncharacterized membrane protein
VAAYLLTFLTGLVLLHPAWSLIFVLQLGLVWLQQCIAAARGLL